MKTWQVTYQDGTVEFIDMDDKGICNMWIYDSYVMEIKEVQNYEK